MKFLIFESKFKLKCVYCSMLVIISLVSITECFQKKDRMSNLNGNMMEYLNSFFSNDIRVNSIKKGGNFPSNSNYRFNEINSSPKNNISSSNTTLEGVFMIQSSAYVDNDKSFPEIELTNKEKYKIPLDKEGWRINTNYNNNTANFLKGKTNFNSNTLFYFYLNDLNVYYSYESNSLNILDAFPINLIQYIERSTSSIFIQGKHEQIYCINLHGNNNINWKMCTPIESSFKEWYCLLKHKLKISDSYCDNKSSPAGNNSIVETVEKKIIQPIFLIPAEARNCNDGWNYDNHGENWECTCKEGNLQTPIDLPFKEAAISTFVKPIFIFNEISPKNTNENFLGNDLEHKPLSLIFKDGAIRIQHDNLGKATTLDGTVYKANEIIFHTPGEHTISGKKFEMEMQVVFYGVTKGDMGKQLLLCFPIKKSPLIYNLFFEDLNINDLPTSTDPIKPIDKTIYIPKIFYNKDDIETPQMKPFSFYTYEGSLSAPPCSENTIVYVVAEPILLSSTTVALFYEALRINLNKECVSDMDIQSGKIIENNRMIQPLNSRAIFYYDHYEMCGIEKKVKVKDKGHYEKIQKTATQYFYVNSDKPSGLPGSLVVSKQEANNLE